MLDGSRTVRIKSMIDWNLLIDEAEIASVLPEAYAHLRAADQAGLDRRLERGAGASRSSLAPPEPVALRPAQCLELLCMSSLSRVWLHQRSLPTAFNSLSASLLPAAISALSAPLPTCVNA